jgi:hypothetical protein
MAFKVGDTVEFNYGDSVEQGEIAFGPFVMQGLSSDRYLVKRSSGKYSALLAAVLTAAPPFKVGDKVRTSLHDAVIEAGPFRGRTNGVAHYVIKRDEDGAISLAPESALALTQPTDLFTWDGITYDLGAEYRDTAGDVWKFTGEYSREGEPLMSCRGRGSGYADWPISEVVRMCFTLTKV